MRDPVISDFFLCVGAQKAGTTWLARMLAHHPEIFFTPVKEIHYFDHLAGITQHLSKRKRRSRRRKHYQRLLTQWHRFPTLSAQGAWYARYMGEPLDDRWYASLFSDRRGRRLAGEATPEYAIIGTEGFEHVRRLAPDVRLIYIMRHPLTRAWSQILHHCRANALDAARLSVDEVLAIALDPRFEAFGDYCRTIDDLHAVFAREQIWLGFYEDIHADRAAALARICAFLGVAFRKQDFPDLSRRYNISQSVAMPEAVSDGLRARYQRQAEGVLERVGRVPESWREAFALPGGKDTA
ncbi:MAG: hypothetical protein Kow0032_13970 [Methyloligellaceae bacterium]